MLDVLAGVASVATIGGLFYAGYQLRQARMAASATTSAHILSNIRSRIEDVSNQINERSLYAATCDLLNELELSCAIYFDGQFGGRTGKLSVSFIKDILRMLENNPKMLACVKRAIQEPDTFECLRKFARKYKKDWQGFVSPSVHSQQSGERAQMVGSQDEI
ncbi:hypothetical protein HNR59_002872 [Aquamicrobium lusatiense]|uniref:DUF4760 domain-containing protein n=1 Tax=Aquamicrobium lusatiense TaxID=89772 RepID=A0A7W9S5R0_9HYPH|nr:hypothetical protein [Aquamicrobium lusatiense]MBB6013483.1 hypothetical protein [Aquamicrobium lusatiense]